MVIASIKDTIRRHGMLEKGFRVVVAVSGGPDSVCLLSALHTLSAELGITLHVAHLDHMFRGAESADEALFVRNLAEKLSLPATIGHVDVPALCRERGLSAQAGARLARYAFLERTADSIGAERIATGHTASDQAETVLMRLLRGAGGSGLSGIPPVRGRVIRPLLGITRDHVTAYLKTAGLAFVNDPSNEKPLYLRNRIRSELIPVLRNFNPRIVERLAREAAVLRDEDDALRAAVDESAKTVCVCEENRVSLARDGFNALLPALRRRILKRALDLAGLDAAQFSSTRIDEALSFMAHAQTGRSLDLAPGAGLAREYGRFLITAAAAAAFPERGIAVPGLTALPGSGMELEAWEATDGQGAPEGKNYRWQAAFDYAKIAAPLIVRSRLPGDRFCPAGMHGKHKKLHDFFIDEKVPRLQRDRIPLICAGTDILWIVGYRTDERFIARDRAKRTLMIGISEAARREEK